MNNKSKLFRKTFLATSIGLLSSGSHAAIEEIVVTAQKREQSLQDVPLAVNAFDANFIKDAKIEDVKGLIDFTPGVYTNTKDSFVDFINIRGIRSSDFGAGLEPSVGIYVDGVYGGRTGAAITSFFDVERAEVVKGPQGTLFGRNASSGAISIVRNKPQEEFGGNVSVDFAERDSVNAQATLNVPLTDTLWARASIAHETEDGYVNNIGGGSDLITRDVLAGRVAFRFTGIEALDATLTVEYEDRELSSTIYRAVDSSVAAINDDFGAPILLFPRGGQTEVDINLLGDDNKDEGEVYSITGDLSYELSNGMTLTSITGIRGSNYTYLEDFDGTATVVNNFGLDQDQKYYSQEFRLNSSAESDVAWFVGLSWYKEEVDAQFDNIIDDDLASSSTPTGTGLLTESNFVDGDYEGWAIYGDVTFQLTERLELTLGARYTYDEKDFENFIPVGTSTGLNGDRSVFQFGFFTPTPIDASSDWDAFTPRVVLNYHWSDDVSTYLSFSQGYKSGGFGTFGVDFSRSANPDFEAFGADNDTAAPAGAEPSEVAEEEVESFELGVKSILWDNRLRLNAAAFYYQFDDLQSTFTDRSTVSDNVGDLKGKGVEIEAQLAPNDYWDVRMGLAYTDTEVDEITNAAVCDPGVCDGNELPYTPEWAFNGVVVYHQPVGDGRVDFTYEYYSQSATFSDFPNRDAIKRGSYDESNIRITYHSPDESWSVTAYVENVFDEFYYDAATEEDPDAFLPDIFFGPAKPRTGGVSVSYNF